MPKNVLIVVHTNTFFVELFRLAKLLKATQEYRPVMFFTYPYPTFLNDALKSMNYHISTLDRYGKELNAQEGPKETPINPAGTRGVTPSTSGATNSKLRWMFSRYVRDNIFRRFIRECIYFQTRFFLIKKVIDKQNPSIVVLGGDMVGHDTSIFVKVAHKKKLSAIIVPSTMSNGLEQAEAYLYDPNRNMGRWVNRFAARLYPRWVFRHRGRDLLREAGERVLLMEWLGLAPPLPWIFNSGFADAIAIESRRMERYYLDCGIPQSQLKVVGSLADDEMFRVLQRKEENRSSLCSGIGLPDSNPILLSALPPDFLYMPGGRPECDFKTYAELMTFWVQSIAKVKGYNIVVCLHPSVRYEDYQYIEDWGVKIADRDTAELVPLCDLYVASVSSTIRWAIACGIPVINYDVYRYRYTDYLGLKGVVIVEEKTDFEAELIKVAMGPTYSKEKRLSQKEVAGQWGMLDGKVASRMISLLEEHIKN